MMDSEVSSIRSGVAVELANPCCRMSERNRGPLSFHHAQRVVRIRQFIRSSFSCPPRTRPSASTHPAGRGRVRARHPSFVFGQSLRALLRTALPHFCWSERARRTTQLSEQNKLPPFSLDGGRDKMQTKDQRAIEANFYSEQRERRSERVKYTSVLPFFGCVVVLERASSHEYYTTICAEVMRSFLIGRTMLLWSSPSTVSGCVEETGRARGRMHVPSTKSCL